MDYWINKDITRAIKEGDITFLKSTFNSKKVNLYNQESYHYYTLGQYTAIYGHVRSFKFFIETIYL